MISEFGSGELPTEAIAKFRWTAERSSPPLRWGDTIHDSLWSADMGQVPIDLLSLPTKLNQAQRRAAIRIVRGYRTISAQHDIELDSAISIAFAGELSCMSV